MDDEDTFERYDTSPDMPGMIFDYELDEWLDIQEVCELLNQLDKVCNFLGDVRERMMKDEM